MGERDVLDGEAERVDDDDVSRRTATGFAADDQVTELRVDPPRPGRKDVLFGPDQTSLPDHPAEQSPPVGPHEVPVIDDHQVGALDDVR
jgi:hypothetical protein